jgi:hypothetical protein
MIDMIRPVVKLKDAYPMLHQMLVDKDARLLALSGIVSDLRITLNDVKISIMHVIDHADNSLKGRGANYGIIRDIGNNIVQNIMEALKRSDTTLKPVPVAPVVSAVVESLQSRGGNAGTHGSEHTRHDGLAADDDGQDSGDEQ